ncbi:hypothetical protein RI570_06625 [Brucella pseudogrignonensis]|uniref:hypothetical protein n=1 Tax=Brucella pseudogrignonensis TaxID=419475 RepID=UPI0028B47E0A|nr:hypothetical protein [Brucella pseudogrignonensis]MDT6939818.1 hypothetical protein [Brucella pseudogrignonensis]
MSNVSGVPSSSYADLGRIVQTGTAGVEAGRQYAFSAAEAAKSGVVNFNYSILQRMDAPVGSNCSTLTATAQGIVRVSVEGVDDPTPVDPVEPGTPSATSKFLFRYPNPPMMQQAS